MTNRLSSMPARTRRMLWIGLLTLSSVALSLIFACATPFAAFATLAALHTRKSDAFLLTVAVWLANQVVGYGILHYPQTLDSVAWGAAIGVAALLATATAIVIERHFFKVVVSVALVSTAAAFLSAFCVYEFALHAAAHVLPSGDSAFSWPVVGDIFKVNVLTLIGLTILSSAAATFGLLQSTTSAIAERH